MLSNNTTREILESVINNYLPKCFSFIVFTMDGLIVVYSGPSKQVTFNK